MMKRTSEGSVDKNGVKPIFFRAEKSDCNGYVLCRIDTTHPVHL